MRKMITVVAALLVSGGISFAATLTFEDVSVGVGSPVPMPQGYGGLNWDNMWVVKQDPSWAGSGLGDALLPGANAADNGFWWYGTISAPFGETFTLNSAYLASCWWFPETLEVKGYLAGRLMYTRTYELSPSALSLVEFPSEVIDSATFTPYAAPNGGERIIAQFIMDSLTINGDAQHIVPWKGKGAGQLTPVLTEAGSADAVFEAGVDTYLGKFDAVGIPDPVTGVTWLTLTAANGDLVYGVVTDISGTLPLVQYKVVIYGGTGRFQGIAGSYVETLTIDPATLAFTATSAGTVNSIGAIN